MPFAPATIRASWPSSIPSGWGLIAFGGTSGWSTTRSETKVSPSIAARIRAWGFTTPVERRYSTSLFFAASEARNSISTRVPWVRSQSISACSSTSGSLVSTRIRSANRWAGSSGPVRVVITVGRPVVSWA